MISIHIIDFTLFSIFCSLLGYLVCFYQLNSELNDAHDSHIADLAKYHNCLEENIRYRSSKIEPSEDFLTNEPR